MSTDKKWLKQAIEVSRACKISASRFSVGAVIVDSQGKEIARGFTGELVAETHAEEAAIRKVLEQGLSLKGASIYCSLEPCSKRSSSKTSCSELILKVGIQRVVFALKEPAIFVEGKGGDTLAHAGVEVVVVSELAKDVEELNKHLLKEVGVL